MYMALSKQKFNISSMCSLMYISEASIKLFRNLSEQLLVEDGGKGEAWHQPHHSGFQHTWQRENLPKRARFGRN